jgi:hypothetical protein
MLIQLLAYRTQVRQAYGRINAVLNTLPAAAKVYNDIAYRLLIHASDNPW